VPPTSPGPSVDLNADIGEDAGGGGGGAGKAVVSGAAGGDEVLLDLVTSVSVACGVHAGDPRTMRRTVEAAARRGVVVGAHPSYPDREGFGRRPMDIPPAQVTVEVRHQVEALDALARRCGTRVRYVKPHGALYHRMADDEECALAVSEALRQVGDLVLLAPAGSRTLGVVESTGVRIATEAFADRAYRPDGRLAPRGAAGSVLPRGGGPAGGRHRGGPPGACRGRDHDRPGCVVDLRPRRHAGSRPAGAARPRGARERRGDPAPLRDVSPRGAVRDVRPFGDGALVAEVASAADAHGLAGTVSDAGWHGVEDVVVGYRSVTVVTDPAAVDIAAMGDELARIPVATRDRGSRRRFEIPVAFDGPDLDDVTALTGMSRDAVVEQLLDSDLEVAFVGFLPGFAYLEGLPPALAAVPRRATPRSAVAAGSVGIGGGFAGVYPQASPGGWQLLGRTGFELFDPGAPPFAVLRPGDGIRFREARDPGAVVPRTRAPLRSVASRTALVEAPGLLSLVQDLGRLGVARLGVPRAGAADPFALRAANRLVGNEDGAAALEVTALGPRLRFGHAAHLAVVGRAEVHLDGRPVEVDTVVPVSPGQEVARGRTLDDLRCYLAVSGGFDVTPLFGSRSSDVLTASAPPAGPGGRWCAPVRDGDPTSCGWSRGPTDSAPASPTSSPGSSPTAPGRWRLRATAWGCAWWGTYPSTRRRRGSPHGGWSRGGAGPPRRPARGAAVRPRHRGRLPGRGHGGARRSRGPRAVPSRRHRALRACGPGRGGPGPCRRRAVSRRGGHGVVPAAL